MKRINRLFLIPVWVCLLSLSANAQNTCATAINIGALPYSSPAHSAGIPTPNLGYSTCGKGNEYTAAMACGSAAANQQDAMFKFVPPLGNECVTITLNGPGIGVPPILDASSALFVFDGCPGAAGTTCVSQVVNTAQPFIKITDLKLTPGRTYYFMVDGGTACYPYQLTVDPGNCKTGSSCVYPIELIFPFTSMPGSTAGMGINYDRTNSCTELDNVGEDIVYHFTITQNQCFRYEVANMSANGVLYITKNCPGDADFSCVRTSVCNMPYCNAIVEEITLDPGDYNIVIKSSSPVVDLNFNLTLESLNPDNNVDCLTCNDKDNCAPCKNAGFEKMSLQNWVGGWGSYWAPGANGGFKTGALNTGLTRHTIVTRGHYDSLVNALPVVAPTGGDYAVRLGNCNNNSQGEQISYSVLIDSSNSNFIYQYAVVLEEPGHDASAQPYFSINLKVGNTDIACAAYEVTARPGLDGFSPGMPSPPNPGIAPESSSSTGSTMYYKNWTTVNIPLIDFLGQVATITFTTKDCSQSGHFGYAYVDATCERLEILRDTNLFCNKDIVKLRAPNGFLTYRWSTGENIQNIEVDKSGVYSVTCTTVTGCVVVLKSKVLIEEAAIADFTWEFDCKDSIVKFEDTSQPQGGHPITSWSWDFGDGDTALTQHPEHMYDSTATYPVSLIVSTEGGCVDTITTPVPVDVFMPQGKPNAIDTIRLCEKETLHLYSDSIPLTIYAWSGPNGFSSNAIKPDRPAVRPSDAGWYRLKVTVKNCVERFDSTFLIVEPLKNPFICPDTVICLGDKAQLYCGGGDSCRWTPSASLSNATSFNPLAQPSVTTIYSVTLFNNLCPDTTLSMEVKPLSGVVSLQMPDTLMVCIGNNITIQPNVNGFNVFQWIGPAGFFSTIANPAITSMDQTKVGYYYVDCSISSNKCILGKDSIWLGINPNPVVNITPDPVVICTGDSIQLTASGARTYLWTPNQFVSNNRIANPYFKPPTTRQYKVTGTDQNGCTASDSIVISVKQLPTPNLGPDLFFCLGDSTYIKPSIQYDSLVWSTNARTDSIQLKNTITAVVTAWSNGCKGNDTLIATFLNPSSFTLGPDVLLCSGAVHPTNINYSPVDSALWNDGLQTLNRNIGIAGSYDVQIYIGKCILMDTIIVNFDTPPVINLGPDSVVCIGSTVFLDATHPRALNYLWNTGATTPTITVASSGNYSATVYSVKCEYADTVLVTVVNPPVLDLGPDQSICQDDSVLFSSNVTGDSYLWSTGETTQSIWTKNSGQYDLTVKFGPCALFDTVVLNVQQRKLFNLGPDQTLCEDQSITVTGPANFDSYLWSSSETTKDISPQVSGTYSLVAIDKLCSSSDAITITFDTIPNFQFPPGPTICEGDTITINSPIVASNYLWSTGEFTGSILVSDEGYYSLFIQNGTCSYSDSTYVTVVVPPALNIGPDQRVCIGDGAQFGDSIPTATYLWNTGATTAFIYQYTAQDYTVEVNFSVCELRDTAYLAVDNMPQPNLGPDQLVCKGTVVNLNANTFGQGFNWNLPSQGTTASTGEAGVYWVEVTNGLCINSDTVIITTQLPHMVLLPPDFEMCSGEKYDIVSVSDAKNGVYTWNTGVNANSLTVFAKGEYVLTVTDGPCVAKDTISIEVWPLPAVEPIYLQICPEDSVLFHLPADYTYFHKSTLQAFTDSILVPKIEYNLLVIDTNGCRWTTYIKTDLDMNCERDVFVPNSFTPNSDGVNDVFKVEAYDLKLIQLLIFDRWGHLVFDTDDPAKGWTGKYKGELCKTDLYEWKLIYEDNYNRRRMKYGHVNLLK